MAPRSKKVCSVPGCPNLTGSGRCNDCTTQAERSRGNSSQRGYTTQWRYKREQFLFDHPFCSVPGCLTPATDVDHIDGLGPHGPLGYSDENLQSLCHPHHSKKTASENRRLFGA